MLSVGAGTALRWRKVLLLQITSGVGFPPQWRISDTVGGISRGGVRVTNISCLKVTWDAWTFAQSPGEPQHVETQLHTYRFIRRGDDVKLLVPLFSLPHYSWHRLATFTCACQCERHTFSCFCFLCIPPNFGLRRAFGKITSLSKKQAGCHATKEPSLEKLKSNLSHWLTKVFFFCFALQQWKSELS